MNEDVLHVLFNVAGSVIAGVRRIFYVLQGTTNTAVGAVEVEFTDGRLLLLDSGPDGESLAVATSQWRDPFSEDRMTPENRDFVARSGKWTAVDVSRHSEYVPLVGATVEAVQPVLSPDGKVVGVIIRTAGGDLRAEVEADDLYVQVG